MKRGLMGPVEKVWLTAGTERVCQHCAGLNGKVVGVDDNFDIPGRILFAGMHETPPAHPRCRCVVQYREIGEPVIRQQEKIPTLTKDEEGAILRYMSSDSYGLNEALRNGEELSEEDKEWVKNLDNALDKMPYYEGSLQRSLSFFSEEGLNGFLKDHQAGYVVTYPAYTSMTANDTPYDTNAQVQIILLHTSHGKDIRHYNSNEQEVLYKRDKKFKVLYNGVVDNVYVIYMEEVGK